jgi:biofilm PGA synthesis N-glycosyltransferase PgaC
MPKENEVSVGIFVYNEEKNIKHILNALLKQKENKILIKEIIVVSSACTDNTDNIVRDFSKKNKKIRLIPQEKREGKASAINLFLKNAKSPLVVIESGDTIPRADCIENLCRPFLEDKKIGLTGARAIPTNDKNTILGGIIHYWWWMHNELPRFGEMIGFRLELAPQISDKTAVDEAYIEAMVLAKGYKCKQIPNAVLENHGAESFKDLVKQRKRIYIGHKRLNQEKKYLVNSFNSQKLMKLTLRYIAKEKSLKTVFDIFVGILIEIYSRIVGAWDIYIANKNPYAWDIAASTKKVK